MFVCVTSRLHFTALRVPLVLIARCSLSSAFGASFFVGCLLSFGTYIQYMFMCIYFVCLCFVRHKRWVKNFLCYVCATFCIAFSAAALFTMLLPSCAEGSSQRSQYIPFHAFAFNHDAYPRISCVVVILSCMIWYVLALHMLLSSSCIAYLFRLPPPLPFVNDVPWTHPS